MKIDLGDDEIMRRAYRMYVDELRRHLSQIKRMLEGGLPRDREGREAAAIVFHTIKGGAGFFGLTEIQESARRIEQLLNGQLETLLNRNSSDESDEDLLRDELAALVAITKTIPEVRDGADATS